MIQFGKYLPSPDLRPYIHSFWTMSAAANPAFQDTTIRLVPDGYLEWTFHLEGLTDFRFHSSGNSPRFKSHFVGHFTNHLDMNFPAEGFLIFSIKFHPWTGHLFWDSAMKSYTNVIVDLWSDGSRDKRELIEAVHESRSNEARIEKVETWLRKQLSVTPDQQLKQLCTGLLTTEAGFKVDDLLEDANLSKRRLEQIFAEKVGLPPKSIHRIHRIRRVIDHMKARPGDSLTTVAHEYNFFDQSHFNREFKRFTGFAPKRFFHHLNPVTGLVNFKID